MHMVAHQKVWYWDVYSPTWWVLLFSFPHILLCKCRELVAGLLLTQFSPPGPNSTMTNTAAEWLISMRHCTVFWSSQLKKVRSFLLLFFSADTKLINKTLQFSLSAILVICTELLWKPRARTYFSGANVIST